MIQSTFDFTYGGNNNKASMKQHNNSIKPIRLQPRKTIVQIGLDFGTTFTKVAYSVSGAPGRKCSVNFGGTEEDKSYYTPSTLIFDSVTNSLLAFASNNAPNYSLVKYFKFNMIVNGLEKNAALNNPDIHTENCKERLCSAFFLACVILVSKSKILKDQQITQEVDWRINLGVPLVKTDNITENCRDVYNEVLNVAFKLAEDDNLKSKINLHSLDELYSSYKMLRNPMLNTVPELYAEVLLYQQDSNVPEGFYVVIDIGGGTSDIAVFYKEFRENESKVTCVAQSVAPFGLESVVRQVITGTGQDMIIKAKRFLINQPIVYLSSARKINPQQYPQINNSERSFSLACLAEGICAKTTAEIRNKFNTQYSKLINVARLRHRRKMQTLVRNGHSIVYFLLGGAGNTPLYGQCVEWVNNVILPEITLPPAVRANINRYLSDSSLVLVRQDQRLLISQMLAQPFDDMPHPDDWQKPPAIQIPRPQINLQDIQDSLYGV